ncbi:MAG: amidase [Rhizobiales bacterium]|nr:amidase [Hyphomicrobiales bacterium]
MTRATARDRLEKALERIRDPKGEGARACLTVYEAAATAAADAADARDKAGVSLGPLDGVVVSIKDLFDVKGEPTRAGSKTCIDAPPAKADAPVVQRLRAAGAVIVAKTNMSEFAFSGVGANPHFGTPGNPADRARVPGGSSSGAAVAAADRMCDISIGSDTGGSTRIPAALCGIVGYKPSKYRVPTDGAFPLSFTLDSIGPLARTVADCALADAVMAGETPRVPEAAPLAGLRLGYPRSKSLLPLDDMVSAAWDKATGALGKAGARISDIDMPLVEDMIEANAGGGFSPPEAFFVHRERLKTQADQIDPNVRARIERGANMSAADYVALSRRRAELVRAMDLRLRDVDALVMPTTPIVAPRQDEVTTPDTFSKKNMALLSYTSVFNFFDLCAISLPLRTEKLPVGLMLIARNGHDHALFRIATGIEKLLCK